MNMPKNVNNEWTKIQQAQNEKAKRDIITQRRMEKQKSLIYMEQLNDQIESQKNLQKANSSFDNLQAQISIQIQLDKMAKHDQEKSNSRERLLGNVMSLQNTQKKQKLKQ